MNARQVEHTQTASTPSSEKRQTLEACFFFSSSSQASFSPQHANSISPSTNRIFTCIPSQTGDKQHSSSLPVLRLLKGLRSTQTILWMWWARAGACTVTANQHRHDLSAAVTHTNLQLLQLTGRLGPTPCGGTHPVRAAARAARFAL